MELTDHNLQPFPPVAFTQAAFKADRKLFPLGENTAETEPTKKDNGDWRIEVEKYRDFLNIKPVGEGAELGLEGDEHEAGGSSRR